MLLTGIYQLTMILIGIFPGTIVMLLILKPNYISEFFTKGIPTLIFMIFAFIILLNIINLITMIFTKYQVKLYDTYFKVYDNEIEYSEVSEVNYFLGALSKYSNGKPCSITLFNEDHEYLCCIERPSFIMTLRLLHRCKNYKFKIKGLGTLLFIMITMIVLAIIIPLINGDI